MGNFCPLQQRTTLGTFKDSPQFKAVSAGHSNKAECCSLKHRPTQEICETSSLPKDKNVGLWGIFCVCMGFFEFESYKKLLLKQNSDAKEAREQCAAEKLLLSNRITEWSHGVFRPEIYVRISTPSHRAQVTTLREIETHSPLSTCKTKGQNPFPCPDSNSICSFVLWLS